MSWLARDDLDRTGKLLLDTGRASDPADAARQLQQLRFQIVVGRDIDRDLAAQAALLTAINAGKRALLGGVYVSILDDPVLRLPWVRGQRLTDAIATAGGHLTGEHDPNVPTFVVGDAPTPPGELVLHGAWQGWSGGVSGTSGDGMTRAAMPLSGVVAGALAVSEIFQQYLGSTQAGRRNTGLSIWRPDLAWQHPDAIGPPLRYLPSGLWLLGLGHLGQANAWSIGCLPYYAPDELLVVLVDDDHVVEANHATGLLLADSDRGQRQRKTRVVAARLEGLGHRTMIVERRFDELMRPSVREPTAALAGFDRPEPRRLLGDRFEVVIDAGLGSGPVDYLDIALHRFPSALTPQEAFPTRPPRQRSLAATYEAEIDRRIAGGANAGDARCGMIELASATVGAAFVGATAGALAIGDVLRLLHDGMSYSVLSVDLRSPDHVDTAIHPSASASNPGYTLAEGLAT